MTARHILVRCLNGRNLPDIFISSINLLQHFDAGDISNSCSQVKRVKRNILDYVSSELFQDKCSKTISDDFVQGVMQFVKTNVLSYKLFIALYLNN